MAVDPVPFFVGQAGVRHSAESVRLGLYASTNGAEGVAGIEDLKVQAQPVPNDTVRVLTGGALLLNRYAGGGNQSYALRNATATDITVTPTGSGGGRTDLVVARILDTQYEGDPPADVNAFQYSRLEIIQGVPAGIKTAKELNLGYPAIALAKIMLPASTGTVTAAMITDLRRVANPRRERQLVAVYPTAPLTMPPVGAYGAWPISAAQRPQVLVPEWATQLQIVAHISGALFTKGSGSDFSRAGVVTQFAGVNAENGILIQDAADTSGRYHYTMIGTHTVAAAQRGTMQSLALLGQRTYGTGVWSADYQTTVAIDYEFSEGAQ